MIQDQAQEEAERGMGMFLSTNHKDAINIDHLLIMFKMN